MATQSWSDCKTDTFIPSWPGFRDCPRGHFPDGNSQQHFRRLIQESEAGRTMTIHACHHWDVAFQHRAGNHRFVCRNQMLEFANSLTRTIISQRLPSQHHGHPPVFILQPKQALLDWKQGLNDMTFGPLDLLSESSGPARGRVVPSADEPCDARGAARGPAPCNIDV